MQAWLPPPLVNRARFAVLSGTVTMVPSTAQTSRPRHHVPRLPRGIAAGPRSRSNSQRSGAAPPAACLRQRPDRRRRHRKADQACGEPGSHPGISQPGKQAPGQQQVDHHPRRQVPDPQGLRCWSHRLNSRIQTLTTRP